MPSKPPPAPASPAAIRLEIDGVGSAVVIFGRMHSLQPFGDPRSVAYDGENWSLDGTASGDLLTAETTITAAGRRLRFSRPHPWTPTAVATVAEGRRDPTQPTHLVFAAGPVLIGADPSSHLPDETASETIALFVASGPAKNRANGEMLLWKLVTSPLDANPVNQIAVPSLIETASIRLRVETAAV